MHCIYSDCNEPVFQVWGYPRYYKRYLTKHLESVHDSSEKCFVCRFCSQVFCDRLTYDEHVRTRCLDNPRVVRRVVAGRGMDEHYPYIRLTNDERMELLEKELLRFPQTVKEDRLLRGKEIPAKGGEFLYDPEKRRGWLDARAASIIRHRKRRKRKRK